MGYEIMKMLCMFDLPMETDKEKRAYRLFRKGLIEEGFIMMQFSVYVRTCPTREYAKRLENRVKKLAPISGNIRLLTVTEKQYNDMVLVVGCKNFKETAFGDERLIII